MTAPIPRPLADVEADLDQLDAEMRRYGDLDLMPEALLDEFARLHMERCRALNCESETAPLVGDLDECRG